jgi:hypothetical protein
VSSPLCERNEQYGLRLRRHVNVECGVRVPCWPSRAPSSNLGTLKRSDDGAAAKALPSRASDPTKPPSATVTLPILHLHRATLFPRRRTTSGSFKIPRSCLAVEATTRTLKEQRNHTYTPAQWRRWARSSSTLSTGCKISSSTPLEMIL